MLDDERSLLVPIAWTGPINAFASAKNPFSSSIAEDRKFQATLKAVRQLPCR